MIRTGFFAVLVATSAHSAGLALPAGTDTIPPTIESARVIYDPGDPEETQCLEFIFSEPVDWFHAIHPDNYTDANTGQTAFQGFWYPPDRVEIRFTTQFWGYGTCEQVRVVNVVDLAGNQIVDDGVGNVFTFHLQQVLVQGRMLAHMHSHDDPPHTFAIEGNAGPLTWSPQCDVPLEDADNDSVYTKLLFFDVPCTTATGGPETRDVEFLFSHQCNELESVPSRMFTLDLAAHPDGRDTLDLWWADGVPTDAAPLATRPIASSLRSISPNPTRSETAVAFSLAARSRVALDVVDVRGRVVRRLESGFRPAGSHRVVWDGRTDRGGFAPAGVYFVRFDADGASSSRRVVLAR